MKMELVIGGEYKRKELHNYFGGQRQGGISTPKDYPYIFIFTNKRGVNYGYVDGWGEDGFFLTLVKDKMEICSSNQVIKQLETTENLIKGVLIRGN